MNVPLTTPVEALYLELGIMPPSIHIKLKRIKYLFYLTKKEEAEMLSRFFWAQWHMPCKGDWVNSVKEDLFDFDIPIDLNFISSFTKYSFKTYVKQKAIDYSYVCMMNRKQKHSKLKQLHYRSLKLQNYLKLDYLTVNEMRTIFSFRVRMCNFNGNYRSKDDCRACPICSMHPDKQELLAECSEIKKKFENASDIIKNIYTEDFTADDIRKLGKMLDFREKCFVDQD